MTVLSIDAGVLNVTYLESGPSDGWPVVLLHGFPYDIHAYDAVADILAAEGARVIVPYLRGYGPTRFLSPDTPRSGQQGALGADLLALLDALELPRVRAIGLSMGANTLLHAAFTARERIEAMVLVSATLYYPAQARAIMRLAGREEQPPEQWEIMRARHAHGDEQIRALWRHAGGFADSYDDMSLTPPHLAAIAARTLIVYGDRDPLYPIEMALEMYRALPQAALCVVPGGGHGPIFGERERSEFSDTAMAFLNQ